MTKERRLAIEMWEGIRDMLSASDGQSPEDISWYKEMFCEDHGLKWLYSCWFCKYISDCVKCPLKSCGFGSIYAIVTSPYSNKDMRIEACNSIIKALGGKV